MPSSNVTSYIFIYWSVLIGQWSHVSESIRITNQSYGSLNQSTKFWPLDSIRRPLKVKSQQNQPKIGCCFPQKKKNVLGGEQLGRTQKNSWTKLTPKIPATEENARAGKRISVKTSDEHSVLLLWADYNDNWKLDEFSQEKECNTSLSQNVRWTLTNHRWRHLVSTDRMNYWGINYPSDGSDCGYKSRNYYGLTVNEYNNIVFPLSKAQWMIHNHLRSSQGQSRMYWKDNTKQMFQFNFY